MYVKSRGTYLLCVQFKELVLLQYKRPVPRYNLCGQHVWEEYVEIACLHTSSVYNWNMTQYVLVLLVQSKFG